MSILYSIVSMVFLFQFTYPNRHRVSFSWERIRLEQLVNNFLINVNLYVKELPSKYIGNNKYGTSIIIDVTSLSIVLFACFGSDLSSDKLWPDAGYIWSKYDISYIELAIGFFGRFFLITLLIIQAFLYILIYLYFSFMSLCMSK